MRTALTSLGQAFAVQCRVINALLIREIVTRYGRHNIGFLWLFLEPMLFTLGVTALWTAIKATHGTSLPITAFALTGYSSLILCLLYHRNVKVIDVFIARLLLEVVGVTASAAFLTIIFSSVGLMSFPVDTVTVIAGWFLMIWFAISLGLIVGAASERSEIIERVWHIFTYLMFPLSGAAFMVEWFSKDVQSILLWVPMVHGTEMIRHGYFGSAVHTFENPVYFALVNSVMLFIGLALVRETGRRVEPE
jgi:capsular polysaccharide transport system permease protein